MPSPWLSPITLRGRHVSLEPLTTAHAPDLLAAATPDLFRFTPQAPPTWDVPGFEQEIAKVLAMEDVVPFAVIVNGRAIGRTTYMEIRPTNRRLEIGRTWLARPHQGTRVNPEMKLLMLAHAFETLAARRVQLTTGGDNLHSQRAIAKLGAIREGLLRNYATRPDGTQRDTVMFSIADAEWPAVKRGLEARLQ